jgi:hypothetical protein
MKSNQTDEIDDLIDFLNGKDDLQKPSSQVEQLVENYSATKKKNEEL